MNKIATFLTNRWTKWVVIVIWIVIAAMIGPLAGKLQGAESNDSSTWLPGKAESAKVLTDLSLFQQTNQVPGVVVYYRSSGLTKADKAKISADSHIFSVDKSVIGPAAKPIFSKDGEVAQVPLTVSFGSEGFTAASDIVDRLTVTAKNQAQGMQVYVTGTAGSASDSGKSFKGIDSTLLYAALGVVTVLLLITYRSPLLWLLPILSAGIALGCAEGIVYLFAKHAGLTVNAQSAGILTVLVFGAATDYALLLIARYREELHNHEDRHEAMALAVKRAGPAIIASALTVIAGMLCLLVAQLNSTRGLGPVSAIGIGVGLLVMITLLPALLVVFGRWLFWPLVPRYGAEAPSTRSIWAKVGRGISKHPRRIWVITTVILLICTIGISTLNANGLSDKATYRTPQQSIEGRDVIARHFPSGSTGNKLVAIGSATSAHSIETALSGVQGIVTVYPPIIKDDKALVVATLRDESDTPGAFATVETARTAVHAKAGNDANVGGASAIQLDTKNASQHDRAVVIPLVLAIVFVILGILLRSFVAPLVLILTVVLSFTATLGICGVLFNHILHIGGADPALPIFAFVFLVALGIDYNIFLMTRIREEVHKEGSRTAALTGLRTTGAVITSAGMVLAGTFAVLASLPLTLLVEIGLSVSIGVLLDTFIVRSVLVTALAFDIGHWMWWPSKLYKDKN